MVLAERSVLATARGAAQALDLVLAQSALLRSYGNILGGARRRVARAHRQDAVRIHIKRDLNLRDASGSGRNARELKFPK